ncbi:hypothetical protein pdam_00009754 [Pocillopora damicornis]|uniref:Uncharacterized protein n=1 Tax=Pocillopora damicornis TaxID=46731 RepID=A0A3M6TP65_POCDA|nr:hypothetical protein pdam_00009754 [Pocillopora damicornis]
MPTEEIKTNPKYQKQIDKSFAVIYHNLKRIHDAKPTEAEQLEITDPGSSSQRRKNRSYSSPSERTLVGFYLEYLDKRFSCMPLINLGIDLKTSTT